MVWGVSRVLMQIINTKLLLLLLSGSDDGDSGSSSETLSTRYNRKIVSTLIQDTLCVRENVRLYNCCGLVTTVY